MASGLITASAQSVGRFTLTASTLDGGAGSCSSGATSAPGARFALAGTVGQLDAGVGDAGVYSLQGGFASSLATPTLPPLHATPSGSALVLSWPDTCQPIVLESAATLGGDQWTTLGTGTVFGGERLYVVTAGTRLQFFRLRKDCPH
jgi:hypothetical protein